MSLNDESSSPTMTKLEGVKFQHFSVNHCGNITFKQRLLCSSLTGKLIRSFLITCRAELLLQVTGSSTVGSRCFLSQSGDVNLQPSDHRFTTVFSGI